MGCDTPFPMSEQEKDPEKKGERIAKYLSRSGVASRRDIEAMVAAGRIMMNGVVIDHPATFVTDADEIAVDGNVIGAQESARLFLFHKPKNVMVAARDPEGRPTIYDVLPREMPRVMPIGRLDYATEGLLLLTNSGALKRHLELPSTGWLRRYRTRVMGEWKPEYGAELEKGITVEGVQFGTIHAVPEARQKHDGRHVWLDVRLREGKNREVRRAMQYFGLHVNRLIRQSYGPFQLGDLTAGEVREVPQKVLREQVGRIWEQL